MTQRDHVGYPYAPVRSRASATQTRATDDNFDDGTTEIADIEQDESSYAQPRPHTSAYKYPVPPNAPGHAQGRPHVQTHPNQRINVSPTRTATHTEAPAALKARKRRLLLFRKPKHPLLYLGLGMILMLGLWDGVTYGLAWWQLHQDDATYGRPRTAHYDVVVGHNDSATHKTHLIAMNLNAHIIIIELPGGDTAKSVIYSGPTLYGQDADLAPVTLTFQDVSGNGKLDMLVHFQGSELIYLNQNGKFVPQQSQ